MICPAHPWNASVGTCTTCGRPICSECLAEVEGQSYCRACALRRWHETDFGSGTEAYFRQSAMLNKLLVWGSVGTETPTNSSGLGAAGRVAGGCAGMELGSVLLDMDLGNRQQNLARIARIGTHRKPGHAFRVGQERK